MSTHRTAEPGPTGPTETPDAPDTLEQLIDDCLRMAEHWRTVPPVQPKDRGAPAGPHGITVSPASAHAVRAMTEYGA
jgi:hypothetical protein